MRAITLIIILLSACGCATPQTLTPPPAHTAKIYRIDEGDPLRSIELQISKVKSDRVVIPTEYLRILVANQKILHGHCKNLSVQLEALKNLDLEDSETNGTNGEIQ
jgi:hypothetical protein